jgi:hypothetical protein
VARHAEFAAAATITEEIVNKVLATYFRESRGPFFFPMPSPLGSGPNPVLFAGIIEADPPTVELHQNSANLATIHFTFRCTVKAQLQRDERLNLPASPPRRYTLEFTSTANAPVIPQIVDEQIVLTVPTNWVNLVKLQVKSLAGGSLSDYIANALNSPLLLTALNNLLHAFGPLVISPPLFKSHFTQTQPADFKDTGVSLFDWFTIDISMSRVVARILEKAVTFGVDFAGFSQGDFNQLVDLTTELSSGTFYYRTVSPTTDMSATPFLQKRGIPSGSSIAFVMNMNVMSQIVVTQVQPRVHNTAVKAVDIGGTTKFVILDYVFAAYSHFVKPLRGTEDGLEVAMVVSVGGLWANVYVYLQAYLQTLDGPTSFLNQPDRWIIYVAYVDVDPSLLAQLLLTFFTLTFEIIKFGFLLPASLLAMWRSDQRDWINQQLDPIESGLTQAEPANIAVGVQGQLLGKSNAILLPPPWSSPLPNTDFPRWDGFINYLSFTEQCFEGGIKTWINWDDAAEPAAVITPTIWEAANRNPIPITLKLRRDLERMAGSNLVLVWSVTRTDNGEEVASAIVPYSTAPFNGPSLHHHSEKLYTANTFTISCIATLTLGNQVGEIWSFSEQLEINDLLDRSHSFVHWGPHDVVFAAPGYTAQAPIFWCHTRNSRVHRTAVAARCQMLKLKAVSVITTTARKKRNFVPLKYIDDLKFDWSTLLMHRKILCEFCFFGGPDKLVPLPREDWFEPFPDIYGQQTMPASDLQRVTFDNL